MKICLITPGHISSNPRLVKEASCLRKNGHEIIIISTQYVSSLIAHDEYISRKYPDLKLVSLNWSDSSMTANFNRISAKLSGAFRNVLFSRCAIGSIEKKINRQYSWQLRQALRTKADLYIGHNLAALPIAVNAAKHHQAKCGFDAEDFHRQELSDDVLSSEYKLAKLIEDKYLPSVDYCTAASPLIAEAYKKLYPVLDITTVNNVFSLDDQLSEIVVDKSNPLKLFWFSQTIGKNRGIEQIWQLLSRLNDLNIVLTLLGNCSCETRMYLDSLSAKYKVNKEKIIILKPIPEHELFLVAAQQHIGLALEERVPLNRDICLTNKLFCYIICGLAIIATNTKAQKTFLDLYPSAGKIFASGNIDSLEQIIRFYYNDRIALKAARLASYNLARNDLNWEKEQGILIKIVNNVLIRE